MTKRNSGKFRRRAQDAYDTPPSAVQPLLRHLLAGTRFCEPCAGAGALMDELVRHGHRCVVATDINPRRDDIGLRDALTIRPGAWECFITNPPWTREILHPLITALRQRVPTWLLFDADWMHTKQAIEHLHFCAKIVSVGRVSWMQNGTSGFDNCAWYLFSADTRRTRFYGRLP